MKDAADLVTQTASFRMRKVGNFYLCSFMEPWFLGKTVEEAKGASKLTPTWGLA